MTNSIMRMMLDPDTQAYVDLVMSDEEWVASLSDAQIIRDKIAAKAQITAAKESDLDEIRTAKAQAALTSIANDLAVIDTANATAVRDMVKRLLIRQDKIIRALIRLS